MTLDLDAMRADAAAGTPGPWTCEPWGDGSSYAGCTNVLSHAAEVVIAAQVIEQDARRVARVPDLETTVLTLTADLAAAQAEVARLREALELARFAMGKVRAFAPSKAHDDLLTGALMVIAEAQSGVSLAKIGGAV